MLKEIENKGSLSCVELMDVGPLTRTSGGGTLLNLLWGV